MQALKRKFEKEGLDPSKVNKEEGYFYDWLLELKSRGYIHKIFIQQTYQLYESVEFPFIREKKLKKSTKVESYVGKVLNPLVYTPDFVIYWNQKARGKFVFLTGDTIPEAITSTLQRMFFGRCGRETVLYDEGKETQYIETVIEIKGTFAARHNSSAITFPIIRKIMFQERGIFVNKVMPMHKTKGIFAKTFTPLTYFKTEKSKVARKIPWTALRIEQFESLFNEDSDEPEKQVTVSD